MLVPDWILEGLGQVEHKKYVGSCYWAYSESLIKIGHDLANEAKVVYLEDVEGS